MRSRQDSLRPEWSVRCLITCGKRWSIERRSEELAHPKKWRKDMSGWRPAGLRSSTAPCCRSTAVWSLAHERLMKSADVLIIDGARTPMSSFLGGLKDVSAIDLAVAASQGAFRRAGVDPEWIDQTVFGNVLQTSADAIYAARHIALKAGVPISAPSLTVNRLCGSGMQAAITAGQLIRLGEAGFVLAGG